MQLKSTQLKTQPIRTGRGDLTGQNHLPLPTQQPGTKVGGENHLTYNSPGLPLRPHPQPGLTPPISKNPKPQFFPPQHLGAERPLPALPLNNSNPLQSYSHRRLHPVQLPTSTLRNHHHQQEGGATARHLKNILSRSSGAHPLQFITPFRSHRQTVGTFMPQLLRAHLAIQPAEPAQGRQPRWRSVFSRS